MAAWQALPATTFERGFSVSECGEKDLWKPGASQTLGRDSLVQVTSIYRYHATTFKPLSICLTLKTACG